MDRHVAERVADHEHEVTRAWRAAGRSADEVTVTVLRRPILRLGGATALGPSSEPGADELGATGNAPGAYSVRMNDVRPSMTAHDGS